MPTDKTEAPEPKNRKARKWPRIVAFFAALVVAFAFINSFLQPIWPNDYWGTSDRSAFYNEPEDTIECIFVGASTYLTGVSPLDLYDQYGISAYNLGTQDQPTFASYYWTKEAYRLHPNSLKVVVLDASMLRKKPADAMYHKALDGMELGEVKSEAIADFTNSPVDFLAAILPIGSYHDRWAEINDSDFYKYTIGTDDQNRGHLTNYQRILDAYVTNGTNEVPAEETVLPVTAINDTTNLQELNREALKYFDKTVEFCQQNGITLVLMRTPTTHWSEGAHNATQQLSEANGLTFLDFTIDPLLGEEGYDGTTDTSDWVHLNFYGAQRLTNSLGNALWSLGVLTDTRGNAAASDTQCQLNEWKVMRSAFDGQWQNSDVASYLHEVNTPDNAVLIAVKEDAATSLVDDQRNVFTSMGLEQLANLGPQDSYIALLESGNVAYEARKKDFAAIASKAPLTYSTVLDDGTTCTLQSGGANTGNIASCKVGPTEYAYNQRGINVVVYSHVWHKVIASTWFDTSTSTYRDVAAYS